MESPLCQTRNCMTFGREKQGRRSPAEFSLTHTMKFHRYAISHPPFYGFAGSHSCVRRRSYQAINLKIPCAQKTFSKVSYIDILISVSGRFLKQPGVDRLRSPNANSGTNKLPTTPSSARVGLLAAVTELLFCFCHSGDQTRRSIS